MIIMAERCYNMRFWIINGEKISIIFVSEVAKMDIQQLERFILKTEKIIFLTTCLRTCVSTPDSYMSAFYVLTEDIDNLENAYQEVKDELKNLL